MKIALVHPKFGYPGGAERYAMGLARGLFRHGHEIHLFGRRFSGDFKDFKVHRISAIPVGRGIKTWSFEKMAGRRLSLDRFDVIQGFGKTTCQTVHRTGGGTHLSYLSRLPEGPLSFYDQVVLRIEKRLFLSPQLRLVICPSQWVADEVRRHHPGMAARLEIVPNGVDSVRFHPEGRDRDRENLLKRLAVKGDIKILLFAAANFHLKGLDMAIKIMSNIDKAILVVLGGDDPAPYVALSRRAGIAERVFFLGMQKEMARFYRGADVLVHPTRYDPFANVCLEAFSCGTPVVTTDCNGFSDLMQKHGVGAVMPVGIDPGEAAKQLTGVMQKGRREKDAARQIALENDLKAHVARVEGLYRKHVLEGGGGEGPLE